MVDLGSRIAVAGSRAAVVVVGLTVSNVAIAGVPECNNLRLTDVRRCELRVEADCEVECENLGVYEKACATQLQTVCSETCTVEADAMCTGGCTELCLPSCDRGENVICIHNCFDECTDGCDLECEGDVDPERCRASCEANCDAECDTACKPLVDGDCYEHCIECCGGSCTAQANLSCQNVCQEQEFEECEHELRGGCTGSCDAEGALFCDGEFVLAGKQIPSCVRALIAQGLPKVDGWAEAEVTITEDGALADVGGGLRSEKVGGGCAVGPGLRQGSLLWVGAAALGLIVFGRRSRPSARR